MATAPFQWYAQGVSRFLAGDIDFDAHAIKVALLASSYTPSQAHVSYADVVADALATGAGYTARGQALTTKTNTVIGDASVTAWSATSSYAVGNVVRPTSANGHIYVAVVAGTSGGSEPSWPTVRRQTVADGGVTWAEAGAALTVLNSDAVAWTTGAGETLTARYGYMYRDTGTDATSYGIAYMNFGSDETASDGGTFTITPDSTGWLRATVGS